MPYHQDRKYDHWLKISPKNIEEKNTNYHEASDVPTPADWKAIEKEQRGENESMYRPWEADGQKESGPDKGFPGPKNQSQNEGFLERTAREEGGRGESGRKPFEGGMAGKEKNPNLHGGGRRGETSGETRGE